MRYYEMPSGDLVFSLLGEGWKRTYGHIDTRMHFHNLMEIGFCWYGDGHLEYGSGQKIPYNDGTFTVFPANVAHNTQSRTDRQIDYWEYLFVDLDGVLNECFGLDHHAREKAEERIAAVPYVLNKEDYPEIERMIWCLLEEFRSPRQRYSKDVIHKMICALILQIASIGVPERATVTVPEQRRSEVQIRPALEYVDLHYAEPIKISQLADACHLSETYFRTVFLETMNMKPLEYVKLQRIQHACEQLLNTNDSMEQVAMSNGFTSQSTFNRAFAKLLGTSPYQWKNRNKDLTSATKEYHINIKKGWM